MTLTTLTTVMTFMTTTRPWSRALAWMFSPQCAACGASVLNGLPFCAPCAVTLLENVRCCPRCAEPLAAARSVTCRRCRGHPLPLQKIIAPWQYGGALGQAIVRLKFGRHTEVARVIAPLIAPVLVAAARMIEATVVVPIPLHWTRRLRRGFDQSALILRHAHALSPAPCPIVPALRRVRATAYQSRMGATARRQNLAAAMAVVPASRPLIAGARVVLFDDVVTTGATMAAAARALLRAGASEIVGVALARGGDL
jgi:ComF family protein